MASLVSSGIHLSPGTLTTKLCMSPTGKELEFMNMAAAIAKLLKKTRGCESPKHRMGSEKHELLTFTESEECAERICYDHRHRCDDREEHGNNP